MIFRIPQYKVYKSPVHFYIANCGQNTGLSRHTAFTLALPKSLGTRSLVTMVTGSFSDMQITEYLGWKGSGCVVMRDVELWVVRVGVYNCSKSEGNHQFKATLHLDQVGN